MDQVAPEHVGLDSRQLGRIGEHLRSAYLEPGKIPGFVVLVAREGQVAYLDMAGHRDIARGEPMTRDTVFRIFSMSKPITSLALMTLYERGLFALGDPVHRYIPAFRNLGVRKAGSFPAFETAPCKRPMTMRDLLTHTSGLTYDFLRESNVDYAYRKLQVGNAKPGYTLADMVEELAQLPLEFSPGERWNYSLSTDVCGHLVEVLSGQPLDQYLEQTLFQPLGMVDTTFNIRPQQLPRFASCYERTAGQPLALMDDGQDSIFQDRTFFSGGGGLLSTAGDYHRFCQMLLNGGQLDGQRVIGARTLAFMTRNHLPGGVDLSQIATGGFAETAFDGVGFGLGFATRLDPVANGSPASRGIFYWGGLASTLFWVDPKEALTVVFMTQLVPSRSFDFRGQLEAIIYASLK